MRLAAATRDAGRGSASGPQTTHACSADTVPAAFAGLPTLDLAVHSGITLAGTTLAGTCFAGAILKGVLRAGTSLVGTSLAGRLGTSLAGRLGISLAGAWLVDGTPGAPAPCGPALSAALRPRPTQCGTEQQRSIALGLAVCSVCADVCRRPVIAV